MTEAELKIFIGQRQGTGSQYIKRIYWGGRHTGDLYETQYLAYRSTKHFCFKYRTFGIQTDIIERLGQWRVPKVTFIIKGTNGAIVLEISLDNYLSSMTIDTLRTRDGAQTFVPLEAFDKVRRYLPNGRFLDFPPDQIEDELEDLDNRPGSGRYSTQTLLPNVIN
jgi:hypothetical protein